jgi:purine nucleosidase
MKALFHFFIGIHLLTILDVSAQRDSMFSKEITNPRIRVIIDNDFGGDPDGLFQLVHHILSPSVEIRGIIGSFIKHEGFFNAPETASNACKEVNELLNVMHLSGKYPVYEGANYNLPDIHTAVISEGSKAIVKEAMRDDSKQPLYVVCGGGLTDIASAYLMEPEIAKRIILIWIGGPEYPDLAILPPGGTTMEYNLGIDVLAGQLVFNHSDISLWQIPRDVYRQAIISYSELLVKVKPQGEIGDYLVRKIEDVMKLTQQYNFSIGETYVLGDSPLVLFTALQSSFNADPSSSRYIVKKAPGISNTGLYETDSSARDIRVYNEIDNRLMFDDFFSKLILFNKKNPVR